MDTKLIVQIVVGLVVLAGLVWAFRDFKKFETSRDRVLREGIRGEVGRTAAGAGVGAIIGGILGGVKGAVLGTIIGGGGTIAATEGKNVDLPQGTVLRMRFDSPVQISTGR